METWEQARDAYLLSLAARTATLFRLMPGQRRMTVCEAPKEAFEHHKEQGMVWRLEDKIRSWRVLRVPAEQYRTDGVWCMMDVPRLSRNVHHAERLLPKRVSRAGLRAGHSLFRCCYS